MSRFSLLSVTSATAEDQTSSGVDLRWTEHYAISSNHTIATPAAKAFVDGDVTVGADTIDETAHGYITGVKGQLTTTGTLPAGLSTSTDYYVIKVDADTYSLATTQANATAGTAVDITAAAGGGTHTFTPTSASIVLQAQASNDNTNWEDISSGSATLTATGTKVINFSNVGYKYVRARLEVAAGTIVSAVLLNLSER